MGNGRRMLLGLLSAYTFLHLGYSVWAYNPFTSSALVQVSDAADWRLPATERLSDKTVYYPPLYYLLILPIVNMDMRLVSCLSYVTQFILLGLALLWLVKAFSRNQRATALSYGVALILAVNFQPFLELVALHAVEGKEFFLIALSIIAFRKGRDALAGAALFLAANLKYLPGILLLYFLLKREYRVLKGAGIALLISLAAVFLMVGPRQMVDYVVRYPLTLLFSPVPESNFTYGNVEWQSVSGTINRWFPQVTPPNTFEHHLNTGVFPTAHPELASGLALSFKFLLGGLFIAFVLRKRWAPREREEQWPFVMLEMVLSLLMILVFVQAIRIHYAILLLPAFLAVAQLFLDRWELFRAREKILFLAAYVLCGRVIPGGLLNRLPPHPLWGQEYANMFLWASLPFYGYLLLAMCILLCYRRLRGSPQPAFVPAEEAGALASRS